jgi:uncharacterized cofD-like protein
MQFRLSNFNSRYLLPGLKRWIVTFSIGIVCIVFGVALLLELRPLTQISTFIWHTIRWFAELVPPRISGPVILIVGISSILFSILYVIRTILDATMHESSSMSDRSPSSSILRSLERAHKKGQGPKIVAIGGGTGLSTLLRGLKGYSNNIVAIVTVGDDGGSSGKLREELGVVPPGDIRNCIVALSDEEEVTTSLFQYRFQKGSLQGHSLGNLFLAALSNLCEGDMAKASQVASRILRTGGQVLPSSLEALHLSAELEDGTIIEGESKIPDSGKRIVKIKADPLPPALAESIQAIKEADLVILGPGSLYTSIIPNLLFPEIVKAINESKAKVLYICNLVQDKETHDYAGSDFIKAIHDHAGVRLVNAILINAPESWNLERGKPVPVDMDVICAEGTEVIIRSKLQDNDGRHNPLRLARSIMQWLSMKQNHREVMGSQSNITPLIVSTNVIKST